MSCSVLGLWGQGQDSVAKTPGQILVAWFFAGAAAGSRSGGRSMGSSSSQARQYTVLGLGRCCHRNTSGPWGEFLVY